MPVTLLLILFASAPSVFAYTINVNTGVKSGVCEELTINLCQDLGYTNASFPNSLGHERQNDAGLEIQNFAPLIKINCAPEFKLFLCYLYAPICPSEHANPPLNEPLLPCRSLCKKVVKGCLQLMTSFGFGWPETLNCNRFPNEKKSGTICLKPDE